jgi:hypothetical protein
LAKAQAARIPSVGIHSQAATPVLLEEKVTTPIAQKKKQVAAAAAVTYLDLLLRAAGYRRPAGHLVCFCCGGGRPVTSEAVTSRLLLVSKKCFSR